jgi:choline dehydrogenase
MPDFDVVVVGAGSSGCVVAHELVESSKTSVCLIEAGPDYGPYDAGRWPKDLLDPRKSTSSHDWGYDASVTGVPGLSITEHRAKVVGGCSAHNQCAAMWGLPVDYDEWSLPGWTYAEVRPLIDAIETVDPEFSTPYRGKNGLVPTRCAKYDELDSWQKVFLDSVVDSGYPILSDLASPAPPEGIMPYHANIKGNIRWNASFAFLDPVRHRPNITIVSDTAVERIVVENDLNASRIICRSSRTGKLFELTARAIALCAGAYGSPLILMKSGIGPRKHLDRIGETCIIDLPSVGSNLQEHPGIFAQFEPTDAAMDALRADLASGRFWEDQVIFRIASRLCTGPFDLHLDPFQTQLEQESGDWAFGVLIENFRPQSLCTVGLKSNNPGEPPEIDFNFFSDPDNRDLSTLLDGLETLRLLISKEKSPFARYSKSETKPGPGAELNLSSAKRWIHDAVTNYSHACGTCKMGNGQEPDSVVDAEGKVHRVNNIFVADASIIPHIPRAGINFTCMMIGKRVGSIVRRFVSL